MDNPDTSKSEIHNHPADEEGIKVVQSLNKMKRRAENSMVNPAQIFCQEVVGLSQATQARLPLEESVKRTLRNHRSKIFPSVPQTLAELSIEGI